jgi:hypothetical protein
LARRGRSVKPRLASNDGLLIYCVLYEIHTACI